MSPKSKGWNEPDGARTHEPTHVSVVLSGLLGHRPFARGLSVGRLAKAWPEVVGERLAAETRPSRLEAGTLVVQATSGPWGSQATFLAKEILKRANQALGEEEVKRVRVVVGPANQKSPKHL